jgi:hypothetical protein
MVQLKSKPRKLDGKAVINGKPIRIGDTIIMDGSQRLEIVNIYIKYNKKIRNFETFVEAEYFNSAYNVIAYTAEIHEHWNDSLVRIKNWLRNYYHEPIPYEY